MKPLLVLNFKTFAESTNANALKLARIADGFAADNKRFQVVLCPSFADLAAVKRAALHCRVFSQHVDALGFGAFTGSFPVSVAKQYCAGSILNHAERKLPFETLKRTISLCKEQNFGALVCADSISEAKKVAALEPDLIAVEPPDLIGSGVSVSTARPELVTAAIGAVKTVRRVPVLVGAGVSNAQDVFRSIELGADGVLVASAFAKSKNPAEWLGELR